MTISLLAFVLIVVLLGMRWAWALSASPITRLVAAPLLMLVTALVSLQVLGLYSLLTRQPVVTVGWAALLLALLLLFDLLLFRSRKGTWPDFGVPRLSGWGLVMAAVALVVVGGALGYGLTHPPIGWDNQHYHVPRALNFLKLRSLTEYYPPVGYTLQHLENGLGFAACHAYPGNWSLLLSILALPKVETLLTLAQFPFAVIGALVVFRLARLLGASRLASGIGGLVFLTAPLVLHQGVIPYSDLFCATWILAALMFLLERSDGAWRFSLAGLSLGLALGSKSTSFIYALVLTLMVLVMLGRTFQKAPGRAFAQLALFGGATLLPAVFWFGQDWFMYGSPVLPFQLKILGVTLFPGLDSTEFGAAQEWSYVARRLDWLVYPWNEKLNIESGYGWLWATLLPLAFAGLGRERWANSELRWRYVALVVFTVGTLAIWWKMTHHEPRYMLHILGLVAVLGVLTLDRIAGRPRAVAMGVMTLGLLGNGLATWSLFDAYHYPGMSRNGYVGMISRTPAAVLDALDALPAGKVYNEKHDGEGTTVSYALYGSHFQHMLVDDQNLISADVGQFRRNLLSDDIRYLFIITKLGSPYLERYTQAAGFEKVIRTDSEGLSQALYRLKPMP